MRFINWLVTATTHVVGCFDVTEVVKPHPDLVERQTRKPQPLLIITTITIWSCVQCINSMVVCICVAFQLNLPQFGYVRIFSVCC